MKRKERRSQSLGVVGTVTSFPRPMWRVWLGRLALVICGPLVVFLLSEGILRLLGYGYPTAFFLRARVNGQDALIQNDQFGWRFFGSVLARTPRPMVVPAAKGPQVCRVFVFGESAAYGDPRPEFGLPRVLEVLLRDRFPGIQFEVINAAMTGINSHAILPIARECARQGGDIWVLYMGNNEVVGPFGSGTVFGSRSAGLGMIRAALALKSTRVGELLDETLRWAGGRNVEQRHWGMGLFLGNQVRHDDARMVAVYAHFARNLEDILKTGREQGVKVVLSTVVSNLRACAPFGSEHRSGLSDENRRAWERLYAAGMDAEQAGRAAQAVGFFEQAGQIDDHFAVLHFRWARCCLALGRHEEARRHFVQARDEDTLRFRVDSRINELIRQAATAWAAKGALLADSEAELARRSPEGLPGEELLYEHVHLNFEGNYWVARCLADQVQEGLPRDLSARAAPRPEWLSISECARRLAWTDYDQYKTLKSIMLRLNEPPFSGQLDQPEHYQRLRQAMERFLSTQTPAGLRQAAGQYRDAISLAPADWVLYRGLGDLLLTMAELPGAEAAYRQVRQLLPQDSQAALQLGLALLQDRQPDQAIEQFQAGLRLKPGAVPLVNALAIAFGSIGKQEEALGLYRQALAAKPDSADTHLNLGVALQSLGRNDEARNHFRQALRCEAETPETLIKLGKVCLSHGWVDEAIDCLRSAARLNPTDANAEFCLGGALDAKGKREEAQAHFTEALRLNPGHAGAHLALGLELVRHGKESEALDQLAEAARLNPNLLEARLNLGLAHLRRGDAATARHEFQEALRIDPYNATAKKQLQSLGPK